MKRLDEELARAVADAHGDPTTRPIVSDASSASPEGPRPDRQRGLAISLVILVSLFAGLVFSGAIGAGTYAYEVADALDARADLDGRSLRIQGNLVSGSLLKRDDPCEFRFTLRQDEGAETVDVRYPFCILPESVRDIQGVPVLVTAEGRFAPEGHLEATNVLGKCPSKYDEKERANQPITLPPREL